MNNINADKTLEIIYQTLNEYRNDPIDIFQINTSKKNFELEYLNNQLNAYIRTINDILTIVHESGKNYSTIRIIEFGSFIGFVSVVLAKIGFNITVADIEIVMSSKKLQLLFEKYSIKCKTVDFNILPLDIQDNGFDIVVCCETIEHLNYNPLYILSEFNRVLKTKGFLYLTLPNITSYANIVNLTNGYSIHTGIQIYIDSFKKNEKYREIGIHWREYTMNEINTLLKEVNFEIKNANYKNDGYDDIKRNPIKQFIKKILHKILSHKTIKSFILKILFDVSISDINKPQLVFYAKKNN